MAHCWVAQCSLAFAMLPADLGESATLDICWQVCRLAVHERDPLS